ncbi:hypothetical protein GCM10020219_102630 [Nonomuraea dietziae]
MDIATYLPGHTRTSAEVEELIEGFRAPRGLIERLTGIAARHVAADDQQASDLAAEAARRLDHDVDLLVFASASQDMVEPATAHIVAAKLGLSCPVFDVKNACNSLLNGVQVAEALIRTGTHRRVLVCTGEVPSRAIRWQVSDREQFVDSFAGYTLSDAGAAVLVAADRRRGIFYRDFSAQSTAWAIGTLPGGGSAHPRDPEYSYFRGDGRRLKEAFEKVGPDLFLNALKRTGPDVGRLRGRGGAPGGAAVPALPRRHAGHPRGPAGRHPAPARQLRVGDAPAAAPARRLGAG